MNKENETNKINVLHIQTELNLACGVTRTISQIIQNSSSEFEHYLIALGGDGVNRFKDFNFTPTLLTHDRFSTLGSLKILFFLIRYCKEHSIEIIHSHHRYFDLFAFLISHFIKVKTITSVQSKVFNKEFLSYKADILIACSNSIKAHVINNFNIDERRIKVIYNSVDPKEVVLTKTKTELLNSFCIPTNKFVIGYFGRLDFKEKGIDILLEAFQNLSKINENIFLLLIGNGVDEIKIRKFLTQSNLNAKMLNSQKDIYNYFQLLDVLILPSRIEPLGIVLVEAGIMKKPVVASNVGGIPEIVENEKSGLLFEFADVKQLTNCILRLINNKEFAHNLSENLYKKINENFLTSMMVELYMQEYNNLLDQSVV